MSDHLPEERLLTIGYSVLADRMQSIQLPPGEPAYELLICVQGDPTPGSELVGFLRVVHVPGVGVAKSRNAAIQSASRRFLLFCDDDVVAHLPGVLEGVRHLERTGRALALGRATDPEGVLRKRYSKGIERLTLFNSARTATYEMLIDLHQVRESGIRFDERFGAGAELYLGDEYIFIADLLRAGLEADAVPFVFGVHPPTSSGTLWGVGDARARAAALNRVFGRWAVFARVGFAIRHWSRLGGRRGVWRFVTDETRAPET